MGKLKIKNSKCKIMPPEGKLKINNSKCKIMPPTSSPWGRDVNGTTNYTNPEAGDVGVLARVG